MPQLHASLLALAAAFTLVGCADPTGPRAAPPETMAPPALARGSGVADRTTSTVTFTISGADCGLATDVTGTAVIQMLTRASQDKSGDWRVAFTWTSHGTAAGADGSQYRFNYAFTGKWVDPAGPSPETGVIDFVDHFNLLGQGKTPDLKVFIHGQFEFNPFTPVNNPVIRGAAYTCDPI